MKWKYTTRKIFVTSGITALIALSLLVCKEVSAQNTLNTLKASYTNYTNHVITEKIYAHTDKDFYSAGEIIWFKLYYTDAREHKPLDVSSVAYIEILDDKNHPVLQEKVALHNSLGQGSFYLPQTISSGKYKLRAYTNWMKNFDAENFFEKIISIVNVRKNDNTATDKNTPEYAIQFFPEGGNLVNNLKNKVAFKSINHQGHAYNFTGYLVANYRDTILKFSPTHAGMGYFEFVPKSNHTYNAIINVDGGNRFTQNLPVAKEDGFTCYLTEAINGDIQVEVNTNSFNEAALFLIAHTREIVKYAVAATLDDGKAIFNFNKAILGDGVSHITIFNSQRQPVCERLYFKKPEKSLLVSLSTDVNNYALRTPVNISVADASVNNDSAEYSMAVYKLDSLQKVTTDANNINTYLFLTSDLKGYIENPNYYFSAGDEASRSADLLMLTHGWRKFNTENIVNNLKPAFTYPPEYHGHIITGNVTEKVSGAPSKRTTVYLGVPSTLTQFRTSLSDSKGDIKFEINNLYGGTNIMAQAYPDADKYKITIHDPFSKVYSNYKYPPLDELLKYPNTLLQQNIAMQVQNIYLAEKNNTFDYPDFVDRKPFYYSAEYKYLLDDYTRFTTLEEVLREYVQVVAVRRRSGKVHFPVINIEENAFFPFDALNLLDGVPVFDQNKFIQFHPHKIKNLDVVNKRYVYGNSIFDGILSWQTYKPQADNYTFDTNIMTVDYKGLQMQREFYTPVYDNVAAVASKLPDFRNVLKWEPNIRLKSGQKKDIKIYTSDIAGKYVVVIEGISSNGNSGYATTTFDVR